MYLMSSGIVGCRFICAVILVGVFCSTHCFAAGTRKNNVDSAILQNINDIWGPVIEQVGKDVFKQIQEREKLNGRESKLRRFSSAETRLADGVLYSLAIEMDVGERIEFSLLDFSEPYATFITSGDTNEDIEKKTTTDPTFGALGFKGPVELFFPKNKELRVKVPNRNIDPGRVRRLIIDHGAAVNGSGFCQIKLLNSIDVERFSIIERTVRDPEPEEIPSEIANVPDPEPTVTKKLKIVYKGTPELLVHDEEDYNPHKLVADGTDSVTDPTKGSAREFTIESNVDVKIKRGDKKNDLILSPAGTQMKHAPAQSLYEVEVPLTPAIMNLIAQFQSSGRDLSRIKRIRSAAAEPVKIFFIPMEVEQDEISFWHVLAVRSVGEKSKLISYQKMPARHDASFSLALTNDSVSLQHQLEGLVTLAQKEHSVGDAATSNGLPQQEHVAKENSNSIPGRPAIDSDETKERQKKRKTREEKRL